MELAEAFKSLDFEVTIFTTTLEEPLKKHFKGYRILHPKDKADLFDFDLIWVQHQLIPINFLKQIELNPEKSPIFIFHHMSPYEPLESPHLCQLENYLSTVSTFNSFETLQKFEHLYDRKDALQLFSNFVPQKFSSQTIEQPSGNKFKRIAVVSNHIPDEVRDLKQHAKDSDLEITFFGSESGDNFELITPELLRNYDCVITIGKTVQYCLVMGIPVFVYDHFGGPGFLNDLNIEKCAFFNYSGRGFNRKTTKEILNELQSNYLKCKIFQWDNLPKFQINYDLESNLNELIENSARTNKSLKISKFNADHYVLAQQMLLNNIQLRLTQNELMKHFSNKVEKLESEYEIACADIADQRKKINELSNELAMQKNRKIVALIDRLAHRVNKIRQFIEGRERHNR